MSDPPSGPSAPAAGADDKGRRRALTVLVTVWVLMVGFVAVQTVLTDHGDAPAAAIEVERCEGAGCYAEVRSVEEGFLFRATCAESVERDPVRLAWSLDGETVAAEPYDPDVHLRDASDRVLAEHVYAVPADGSAHEIELTCHYADGSTDGAAARVAVRTDA